MLGGGQARVGEDLAEGAAVLGGVDGLGRGADDGYAVVLERLGETEGVWPPSWTMTPAMGPASDSAWTISSTSSSVSGSKYRRSEVS